MTGALASGTVQQDFSAERRKIDMGLVDRIYGRRGAEDSARPERVYSDEMVLVNYACE